MKIKILFASLALIALSAVGTAAPTTVSKQPSEVVLKANPPSFEICLVTAPVEGVLVEIENPAFSDLSGFYLFENTGKIPLSPSGESSYLSATKTNTMNVKLEIQPFISPTSVFFKTDPGKRQDGFNPVASKNNLHLLDPQTAEDYAESMKQAFLTEWQRQKAERGDSHTG